MAQTSDFDDRGFDPETGSGRGASESDSLFDSLRIQAAAVVAQQSALTELEIRLTDREAALARQEDQLASHLEGQRRQLLDLQDQITHARSSLREKRSAFAILAAEHDGQLKTARREVEKAQKQVAHRETRVARLWTKLKARIRQRQSALQRQRERIESHLERQEQQVAGERARLAKDREKFHGQAELEKREIADGWVSLHEAEQTIHQRLASLAIRERDLARKEKAQSAHERRQATSDRQNQARRDQLKHEIERLEARAVNTRAALERIRGHALPPQPQQTVVESPPSNHERHLDEIADTLADEQLLLTEHVDHFARVRMEWEEERVRALAEFDDAAAELGNRERALAAREAEVVESESRVAAEEQAMSQVQQQLEADRLKASIDAANRRAELNRMAEELAAQSRELSRREESLTELYQRWGKRRSEALAELRDAQRANALARDEWAELHGTWLRAQSRLIGDQQDVAARRLAVEQYRTEYVESSDQPEVAARRLERLRRQWMIRCTSAKRDLLRLSAALKTESDRLDRRFSELQQEEKRIHARLADVSDLCAVGEVQQVHIAAERIHRQERAAAEKALREGYERQISALRDQIDHLASLFIEAPTSSGSQAA